MAVTLDGAGKQEHWKTPAAIEDTSSARRGSCMCCLHLIPHDPAQATNLFFGMTIGFEV